MTGPLSPDDQLLSHLLRVTLPPALSRSQGALSSPPGGRAAVTVQRWPWRRRPLGSCSLRWQSAVCQMSIELGSFTPRSEFVLIDEDACYSYSGLLRRHLEILMQNMLIWSHLFPSIEL